MAGDSRTTHGEGALRADVLRVPEAAKQAVHRDALTRQVGQNLATVRPVIEALDREGSFASDNEPFDLRGRLPMRT